MCPDVNKCYEYKGNGVTNHEKGLIIYITDIVHSYLSDDSYVVNARVIKIGATKGSRYKNVGNIAHFYMQMHFWDQIDYVVHETIYDELQATLTR